MKTLLTAGVVAAALAFTAVPAEAGITPVNHSGPSISFGFFWPAPVYRPRPYVEHYLYYQPAPRYRHHYHRRHDGDRHWKHDRRGKGHWKHNRRGRGGRGD